MRYRGRLVILYVGLEPDGGVAVGYHLIGDVAQPPIKPTDTSAYWRAVQRQHWCGGGNH